MTGKSKYLASMLALFLVAIARCAGAETFYATSVRTAATAPDAAGTLYKIDPATAAATVVAPMRLDGVHPIGALGLAMHPRSGVFYGITGQYSAAAPRSLVTIDPETGRAALVGPLGSAGSDIVFDPEGTLYVWLAEINQLGTIDLSSGKATPKGSSGIDPADSSGAIAIASSGAGFVAATGATGTLDALDLKTGRRTLGPALNGAPFPNAITNLSFAPSGRLYAVNSSSGAPAEAVLVVIDPATGTITPIGALPADIEGLVFASRAREFSVKSHWGLISSVLAALVIAVLFVSMPFMSRRQN